MGWGEGDKNWTFYWVSMFWWNIWLHKMVVHWSLIRNYDGHRKKCYEKNRKPATLSLKVVSLCFSSEAWIQWEEVLSRAQGGVSWLRPHLGPCPHPSVPHRSPTCPLQAAPTWAALRVCLRTVRVWWCPRLLRTTHRPFQVRLRSHHTNAIIQAICLKQRN